MWLAIGERHRFRIPPVGFGPREMGVHRCGDLFMQWGVELIEELSSYREENAFASAQQGIGFKGRKVTLRPWNSENFFWRVLSI